MSNDNVQCIMNKKLFYFFLVVLIFCFFVGIILFVMVPFQGSGGLVGSILGRLIGMKPWSIFLAISTGAIIGCLLIAYFADAILSVFVKNFLQVVLLFIIIFVILIMLYFYKKNKNSTKIDK